MAIIPATWDMYDLIQGFLQAPAYHLVFEALLILLIAKLFFSKSYKPEKITLSEKEKEELVADWKPEPLVPDVPDDNPILQAMDKYCISGPAGKMINVNGKNCINMATLNFLGFIGNQEIEEEAVKALMKYGVGSCGPRGFYGTMDVHLELEEQLARFMQTEEAILYSYGFVTIASAIPAYSKRSDIIFADEGIGFAAQKGIVASRSTVKWFRHNDMDHLEQLLKQQQAEEKKNPKKAKATRKFLVVEGIYANYGDICPLPRLMELKWQYKVRIFLEESLSFGVLGATGRGLTEHFDVPIEDVEMITASLENSMASIGGFCCGKKFIIDHQRLSGMGYCFSASQPPMVAVAATKALELMERDPTMLVKLRENCARVHQAVQHMDGVEVRGSALSPVQHLQLSEPAADRELDMRTLQMVQDLSVNQGVAITLARYLEKEEHLVPQPSIRLAVSAHLSTEEIDRSMSVIKKAFDTVLHCKNTGHGGDGDCTLPAVNVPASSSHLLG
ncbi:serine palmitoyltransferase 1-like [Babylonia areolata]|uniref:serine palmitoyltransferase 1-like n=1 Tax=Babylonia areolata TaxID=304850 RepID=UPI003FD2EDDA